MQRLDHATAAFRRTFIVTVARTTEQIQEAFRLRYQVYCLERGFEAATLDGIERDRFDDLARHVIVCERVTGQVVGTLRFILPGAGDCPAHSMPVRQLCPPSLLHSLPIATTAEVSRFAISKERRGAFDGAGLLRLGLVQGGIRLSRELGLTHWCAVMEPCLLRLMCSTGLRFAPIGPLVEHHGMRQPCIAHIDTVLAEMAVKQPALWEFMTERGSLWPSPERRIAA